MARLQVIQMRRFTKIYFYPLFAHSKRTATISQCSMCGGRVRTRIAKATQAMGGRQPVHAGRLTTTTTITTTTTTCEPDVSAIVTKLTATVPTRSSRCSFQTLAYVCVCVCVRARAMLQILFSLSTPRERPRYYILYIGEPTIVG